MQRVVSINLNGNAYQVEENGYNALFAYLDSFEASLKDSPDRAQKLADLERSVAEKCQTYLSAGKTVITSAEIDRILSELEPAPSPPAGAPGSTDAPKTAPSDSRQSGHRRLYQVREGAMISGVCVGLSEFLHLDVTLIRILFVVFALVTSGWGILAYGVLMFVVPRVDTRAEASDASTSGSVPPHRWPWDDGWPWDYRHEERPAARDQRQELRDRRQEQRAQRREWREQRRMARAAHPGSAFGTIMMIVCLMFAFFWLSFWTRGHFFFGWPFFWGFPHWIGIIFFLLMLRLIFMPFRVARWYGYGPYAPYPHPGYAWAAMWNGLTWFLVMIFAVWLAFHYIPEVHDLIRDFQTSWRDDFHV